MLSYFTEVLPSQVQLLPFWFQVLVVACFSGLLGSFLNMAVWRIPRGESIVFPRSHCPACGHVLGFSDLIPVFSYVFLGGKCAYCGIKYGPRYMWIELLLILALSLSFILFGWSLPFFISVPFAATVVFFSGIRHDRATKLHGKRGFTFIEVMLALVIVAAIIIPFGNMFLSSYSRVVKNKQYIMAYNLLEEKLEELRLVPFSKLSSDWHVYAKTPDPRRSVFVDEHVGPYQKMKVDEEFFEKNFSDVMTESAHLPDILYKKFLKRYEDYYGRDYRLYPGGYEIFKRTVKVEPVSVEKDKRFAPARLEGENVVDFVKVTVIVWIDSDIMQRKLSISCYRRK
jgi:prepilin-type N-terminal cleavage/methylation domain-containing protein